LVCYRYYEGVIYFIIGIIFNDFPLNKRISKEQKNKAIEVLEIIHKHGIFYNNIRKKNILFYSNNYNIYLIDFRLLN